MQISRLECVIKSYIITFVILSLPWQEARIQVVREIGKELAQETFHDLEGVKVREVVIETKWEALQRKLEACRDTLSCYHDLMSLFADMDDCLGDMTQIEVRMSTL